MSTEITRVFMFGNTQTAITVNADTIIEFFKAQERYSDAPQHRALIVILEELCLEGLRK